MARSLSREFIEVKTALERKLSRESPKDEIIRDAYLAIPKKENKLHWYSFNKKRSGDSNNDNCKNDTESPEFASANCSKDRKPSTDCINLFAERRNSKNAVDTNCNIDNHDADSTNTSNKSLSTADKTCNPDRKMSRSISSVNKFIPVLYDGIPHHIQEKARVELNETDENIQNGLMKLKTYMKKEKLPFVEDDYLMACLRVSKYEWKKAQDRLNWYYRLRCKMADKFEKLDLDTVRKVLRHNMVGYLPYRDEDGRCIFYTQGVNWYPEICDFEDYVLVTSVVIFHLISIPVTTVSGFRYLCDVRARTYQQYYQYYKCFKTNLSLTTTMPLRLQVDCVHDNSACQWLFNLLRPLIPPKIAKRIRLHGYSYESLHTEVDFSILPTEYGGIMGPLNNEFLMEKLEEFFHKFKAQNALFMKR